MSLHTCPICNKQVDTSLGGAAIVPNKGYVHMVCIGNDSSSMIRRPLDGIRIEVTIVGVDKHKRYSTTPVDDTPELVAYYLRKFAKDYAREAALHQPNQKKGTVIE